MVNFTDFCKQLTDRVNNPTGLNQGENTDFCWASSCMAYLYETNPKGMVDAMFSLYLTGSFKYNTGLGDLIMTPTSVERDAVGSSTFDNNKGLTGHVVDQMLLLSAAENFKGYMNKINKTYKPGDEDNKWWAGAPLSKAHDMWTAFGFNVIVSGTDLWPMPYGQEQDIMTHMANNYSVVLFINSELFKFNRGANTSATHYIRLKALSQTNNIDNVTYWDYGANHTFKIDKGRFNKSLYGIIYIKQ